jgi:hypothetical protein
VLGADLDHLRGDEALDEAEHVGVRPALDLAEQPLLALVQERQAVGLRESVRQELLPEVERPAADHVVVDVEADAFRVRDALGVAVGVDGVFD